ncbi:MAG: phosphonate C-P lyase system protein PhnG [Planctomycetota bacterium]|nr:MAG: phosphonate C-P lyase system protein PhnG [Planctomycetota bacterium]
MPLVTEPNRQLPERSQWGRCLLLCDGAAVQRTAKALADRYVVAHHQRPQEGLTMLQMREPNRGEAFLLGELPTASAAVSLRDSNGNTIYGGVVLMHHDQDFAVAAAIIDAVVAAAWTGAEDAAQLITEGWQRLCHEDAIRGALLTRTTVDFALLEAADDDEEDDDA